MENNIVLTTEEYLSLKLAGIYNAVGYKRFRMSKFEEYGLYLENKNFLTNDNIITFNDLDGKLLALKPDVTLSIVKNLTDNFNGVKKLYYNENVYRLDKSTSRYREIGQTGLEAIGDIDNFTLFEVINLALKSLLEIDSNFVLDISDLNFVTGYLDELNLAEEYRINILRLIGEKNLDDLLNYSTEIGLNNENKYVLKKFITANGDFNKTIRIAKTLVVNDKMKEAIDCLQQLFEALKTTDFCDKIRLDFSIINDTNYYNGLVFQGYVAKIPRAVLSGGRYDKLAQKYISNTKAIGFAVYLNEVAAFYNELSVNDVDVLILYDKDCNVSKLNSVITQYIGLGKSVLAENAMPENIRFGEIVRLSEFKTEAIKC